MYVLLSHDFWHFSVLVPLVSPAVQYKFISVSEEHTASNSGVEGKPSKKLTANRMTECAGITFGQNDGGHGHHYENSDPP
jgi:hypothetical protein